MKISRFNHEGQPVYGLVSGETIVAVAPSLLDLRENTIHKSSVNYALNAVQALAPVERPGKIIAIGLNYRDHAREQGKEPPAKPLIFSKFTTAIIQHGETIRWSTDITQQVDYEGELAVIIGKRAWQVSEETALDYVLGYTIANDVSARDLQYSDGQWIRSKSLETFCPLGPVMVTADDIPDPQNLAIRTLVNGDVMQNSTTAEMIFSVAHLIAYCSRHFTLEPDDIILTGTPDGVGMHRKPQRFLQDGDTVSVEIEGIGRLENRCAVRS